MTNDRDRDGTEGGDANAAPGPKPCHARAEGIAQTTYPNPLTGKGEVVQADEIERVARRLCFWDGPEGCGCVERCEHDMEPTNIWHQAATIAVEEIAALRDHLTAQPVTVASPGYEAGLAEGRREVERLIERFSDAAILKLDIHEDSPVLARICDELRREFLPTSTVPTNGDDHG